MSESDSFDSVEENTESGYFSQFVTRYKRPLYVVSGAVGLLVAGWFAVKWYKSSGGGGGEHMCSSALCDAIEKTGH